MKRVVVRPRPERGERQSPVTAAPERMVGDSPRQMSVWLLQVGQVSHTELLNSGYGAKLTIPQFGTCYQMGTKWC